MISSRGRKPRDCSVSNPQVSTNVRPRLVSNGRPSSRLSPIAAPIVSMRGPVAIAAISLPIHIASGDRPRGKWLRHSVARLCPVTMPSRADIAWNSMAIMFASRTTQSSP